MVRKKNEKSQRQNNLPVLRANAGGIDISATELFVAVPPGRDPEGMDVRSFPVFTQDIHRLAAWLKQCQVNTVAMESTGVYWIPTFQILEDHGIEVFLVNAHHVKNVAGRKSDVIDCQWLQFLHSVGLLQPSYRPPAQVCAIRTLVRHRDSLIKSASTHVNRMQKAMTQMNLQLHNVISDITGQTGLAIIDAIINNERDPQALASLRSKRIKASEEVIVKSLIGDYRPELVFTLRQSLDSYRHYQKLILECDQQIRSLLDAFDSALPDDSDHDGSFESELKRVFGVDLTKVPGLGTDTVQTVLAEVGPNFSKFRSASAFASWLTLCPNNHVSGGKILSKRTKKSGSKAATALRRAAWALHHSKSSLGTFYRRMRSKHGPMKAITAVAHRLARLIFHLVTTHQEYDESRFALDHCDRQRQERTLRRRAKSLGFELVPLPQASC